MEVGKPTGTGQFMAVLSHYEAVIDVIRSVGIDAFIYYKSGDLARCHRSLTRKLTDFDR